MRKKEPCISFQKDIVIFTLEKLVWYVKVKLFIIKYVEKIPFKILHFIGLFMCAYEAKKNTILPTNIKFKTLVSVGFVILKINILSVITNKKTLYY